MTRTTMITGASRGIGRAIAERRAAAGDRLVLLGRNQDALAAVAAACQGSAMVTTLAGELTDENFIRAALVEVEATHGGVDVLINNAGTASQQAVQHAELSRWRQVMQLNFDAVMTLCTLVLPGMISRQQGTIVNISSISGRNTDAGSAIYTASKHALNGFSGCMYEDARDHGIKVSTIMPGFVATDLTSGFGMTEEHMIQPSDIADAVDYVLQASKYCCPTEVVIRPQKRP